MPKAPYEVLFSNFSSIIHYISQIKNQCKLKWTKKKIIRGKNKENKDNKKKKRMKRNI